MGNGNGRLQKVRFESMGALPAGRCPADSPGLLESFQGVAQAFVFDRERFTKLRPRQHSVFGEQIQHSFLNVTSLLATDVSRSPQDAWSPRRSRRDRGTPIEPLPPRGARSTTSGDRRFS